MATQTRLVLVDDLDGGPASTTVEFGLDRHRYAIDLSAENAARLRGVLGEYVEAARVRHDAPTPALRRSTPSRTTAASAPVLPGTRAPACPAPSLYAEIVAEVAEIVADLTTDVRRAVLEVLMVVLDVLHDRLATARRRSPL